MNNYNCKPHQSNIITKKTQTFEIKRTRNDNHKIGARCVELD